MRKVGRNSWQELLLLSPLLKAILISTILVSALTVFFSTVLDINTQYLDDVALLVMVFFIVITGRFWRDTDILKAVTIFFVLATISSVLNAVPIENSLLQLRSYLFPVAAYFTIVFMLRNQIYHWQIIKFILNFTLVLCLIGTVEAVFLKHVMNEFNKFGEISAVFRIHSLIGHPADYGYYLISPLILVILLLQERKLSRFGRVYLSVVGIFFSLNLALTASKGPLFVLVLSALLYSLIAEREHRNMVLIMIVGFLVIGGAVSFEIWQQRLVGFWEGEVLAEHDNLTEATRVGFYLQSAKVIGDNSWFGVGPGQFGGWVATMLGSDVHQMYGIETFGISSIDVFYPHLVGEVGFLGFIAYLGIYVMVFRNSMKRLKRAREVRDIRQIFFAKYAIWLTIMFVMCGFHSMINETFPHMILYWTLIGIAEVQTKDPVRGRLVENVA